MKEIFKRYLVFVIGLYFLAAGIVLIIRSALGTTPISSINYVLSLNSPYRWVLAHLSSTWCLSWDSSG